MFSVADHANASVAEEIDYWESLIAMSSFVPSQRLFLGVADFFGYGLFGVVGRTEPGISPVGA